MPIDVLIVGQGLAGSLLAWELIRQDQQIMVIDPGAENASKVAAGLLNPVTGQRLVKSAELDHLLPAALQCYQELGLEFKQRFFTPLSMLRILKNPREQQFAKQRLNQLEYQDFLHVASNIPSEIHHSYGVLQQQQTGYLKTRLLLEIIRDFLINQASYRQTKLDYADIQLQPQLQWHDLQPQHIVFCEGHHASLNPWFGGLPFQLAKGEILNCHVPDQCPEQILNFGYWLVPNSMHHFRIGATFEPGVTDTQTTKRAEDILLKALDEIYPSLKNIQILAQQAGIRPTTLDKQPFVGSHPQHNNLHIFNGFGAKGSLVIPWYARQFVAALKQQAVLPLNSHIRRYYETHFAH